MHHKLYPATAHSLKEKKEKGSPSDLCWRNALHSARSEHDSIVKEVLTAFTQINEFIAPPSLTWKPMSSACTHVSDVMPPSAMMGSCAPCCCNRDLSWSGSNFAAAYPWEKQVSS